MAIKYLVFNTNCQEYFMNNGNWTKLINKASSFSSEKAAQNYIDNTAPIPFRPYCKVIEYDPEMFIENPDEVFETLHIKLNDFTTVSTNIHALKTYYSDQLSHYDLMQQDILHKFEFDKISNLQAIQLVRKLQEIRHKRREAKNKLNLLSLLECGNIKDLKSIVGSYEKEKKYQPRVLTELFK